MLISVVEPSAEEGQISELSFPRNVSVAAYVNITEKALREKIEKLLIRFLKSNAVINKQSVDR